MSCTCKQWKIQYSRCGHRLPDPHKKTRYCPAARRRQLATGARRPSICSGGPAQRSTTAKAGWCTRPRCEEREEQERAQELVRERGYCWECCKCRERGGRNLFCVRCQHDICRDCRAATATPSTPSIRDSRAISHDSKHSGSRHSGSRHSGSRHSGSGH